MITKTIRVLAASALLVTPWPALVGKDWNDHDHRDRHYSHRSVVVHHLIGGMLGSHYYGHTA